MREDKQSESVTLVFRKLQWAFVTTVHKLIQQVVDILMVKISLARSPTFDLSLKSLRSISMSQSFALIKQLKELGVVELDC